VLALGSGALVLPLTSLAQRAAKSFRIGFLASEAASDRYQMTRLNTIRSGLGELGYVEGKNIVIEARFAEGSYDRLPALAAELVRLRVDVIVASGSKATIAATNATATIPIVVGGSGDFVAMGVTSNLARPSSNVTGWMTLGPEAESKLVELLKLADPRITKLAYLVNAANPPTALAAIQVASRSLSLGVRLFEARKPQDLPGSFAELARAGCTAVVVQSDTMFGVNVRTVAELALTHRLASASRLYEFATAGGLLRYGADPIEGYRRAAVFVDKILRGTKPGDLPIEQPTTFELTINMATATSLGLSIPPSLQMRARLV